MLIKNVSLIGLGALGIMYANHLSQFMPKEDLRIIADQSRVDAYQKNQIYCNDQPCDFNYITPDSQCPPADLLIFAVKYTQLPEAILAVKNHIGPNTIILSLLNGVVSETDIGNIYGHEHNLYCVAQGMDALKIGNHMTYKHMGLLCFGELDARDDSKKVRSVANFFDKMALPYEINNQMNHKLWSKLMANVGINQTVAILNATNRIVQEDMTARQLMIDAMDEVRVIGNLEGIPLSKEDIDYWLKIIDSLNPDSMPSMAQDLRAKRHSEVDLFSGTILNLARKHQIQVPVNEDFYRRITAIESHY
jgi:2-dehydropantoate 2-reductase